MKGPVHVETKVCLERAGGFQRVHGLIGAAALVDAEERSREETQCNSYDVVKNFRHASPGILGQFERERSESVMMPGRRQFFC